MLLKGPILAASAALFAGFSLTQPARVVAAYTSHILCSAKFVSGLDPDEVYAETIRTTPGFRLIDWALRYQVDPEQRQVTTTIAGGWTRRAVFREGLGCIVAQDDREAELLRRQSFSPAPPMPPLLPPIAGTEVVVPGDPALKAALDDAFAETGDPIDRRTKAVVVVHDGRIVAERYARGYGVDTPLISNSAVKSVVNGMIGVLVRDGKLSSQQSAPVAAWSDPADPRHAITIDNLLRHTSGLAIGETGSGFDAVSRMLLLESDMAGFAEAAPLEAPPGSRWSYDSGNYIILSRLIRDAAGGSAEAVLRFAHRELFDPLGMRNVTFEVDATGTPMGSAFMFASARDWARFGLLFLNDGVVGGRRILPEGWVRYSSPLTPGARYGYGAGLWTTQGPSPGVEQWLAWGLPKDAYFAHGRLGQFVVVVPSERLVVVRFGVTQHAPFGDDKGVARLVAEIIAAIHRKTARSE